MRPVDEIADSRLVADDADKLCVADQTFTVNLDDVVEMLMEDPRRPGRDRSLVVSVLNEEVLARHPCAAKAGKARLTWPRALLRLLLPALSHPGKPLKPWYGPYAGGELSVALRELIAPERRGLQRSRPSSSWATTVA